MFVNRPRFINGYKKPIQIVCTSHLDSRFLYLGFWIISQALPWGMFPPLMNAETINWFRVSGSDLTVGFSVVDSKPSIYFSRPYLEPSVTNCFLLFNNYVKMTFVGFDCGIQNQDGIQEPDNFGWVHQFSINYICAQISKTLS